MEGRAAREVAGLHAVTTALGGSSRTRFSSAAWAARVQPKSARRAHSEARLVPCFAPPGLRRTDDHQIRCKTSYQRARAGELTRRTQISNLAHVRQMDATTSRRKYSKTRGRYGT